MNPSSTHGPELQLPAPVSYDTQTQALSSNPEAATMLPEQHGSLGESMPILPQPTAAVPLPQPLPIPHITPTADVSTTTNISVPAVADDQDLIEKEWVAKAKQIVEKTRDNPYQQSQELTVFKNDYMQKRYNKTIKLGE